MNHRHLLPDEIDLLLDNEEGFGMAPLRGHIDECPACRFELEVLAGAMASLEALPHLAPPSMFAEQVMAKVQVFEPWHVTIRDRVLGLVPQSVAGRVVAAASGGVLAVITTFVGVWVARRADAVLFVGGLALERARELAWSAMQAGVTAIAGETAVSSLQAGGTLAMAGAVAATAGALGVVAYGVKAVASAGQRRRV